MLEQITKLIEDLTLGEEVKELLYKEIKAVKKNIEVVEFKYHRTLVDKSAITNVLNASIQEIEAQKKNVENAKNEILGWEQLKKSPIAIEIILCIL